MRQELTIQRNNLKKGKMKIKEKLNKNNFFNINLPDRMLLLTNRMQTVKNKTYCG